jgi:uncharacterized protein YndB with AHSA1/START domain
MTITLRPAPVRKSVVVQADIQRAFDAFVGRIGSWWPRFASIGTAPQTDVIIEPRAGGRWYERGSDGSECEWGKVLHWEPPTRLILAWQVDGNFRYNAALITEVEIHFTVLAARETRVDLEHRCLDRMGESAAAVREHLDSGWGRILEGYGQLASAP